MRALILASLLLAACAPAPAERQARLAGQRFDAPCIEEATLLGTSAGSPSEDICWNRQHRIETSPITVAGKDVAVLVICRCGPAPPVLPKEER